MAELTYKPGKLCRLYFDASDAPSYSAPTMVEIGYFVEGGITPNAENEEAHFKIGRGVISTLVTGFKPQIKGKVHWLKGLTVDIWNILCKRVLQASTLGLPILVEACYGDRTVTGNVGLKMRAVHIGGEETWEKNVAADVDFVPSIPDSDGNLYTFYEVGS